MFFALYDQDAHYVPVRAVVRAVPVTALNPWQISQKSLGFIQ